MKGHTMAILFTQLFAVLLIVAGEGHDCGPNEQWNDCGTACEKTCKNRDLQFACIAVCTPGCFCNENYIRQSENGPCVLNC